MKLFTSKHLSFKLVVLLIFVTFINAVAQETSRYPLIPYPAKLIAGKGAFIITSKTNIITAARFKDEANELTELLSNGLGKKLSVTKNTKPHSIKLVYDAAIATPEAYKLTVTSQQVIIAAKDPAGVFHAVETIRQL